MLCVTDSEPWRRVCSWVALSRAVTAIALFCEAGSVVSVNCRAEAENPTAGGTSIEIREGLAVGVNRERREAFRRRSCSRGAHCRHLDNTSFRRHGDHCTGPDAAVGNRTGGVRWLIFIATGRRLPGSDHQLGQGSSHDSRGVRAHDGVRRW